ncbi:MAG: GDP-mannose 4,6-dehydratase [Rhodospirillaceae bacterium]|nr:GDP-mannose 4,6-dehydratase [Rhodospirillaceae bacterium]
MVKRALVTGITGQDGAYLARLLLDRGYEVYGGARRPAAASTWRLEALGIRDRVRLVEFELFDEAAMKTQIAALRPDEIYNLAGQSLVSASFNQPLYTTRANGIAVAHMLEILRQGGRPIRFYQASTSEMFGRASESPQSETTAFQPQSPYAIAKVYAHWLTVNYRQAYGLHACTGILFNHESPLRGLEFVTRKITSSLARIKALGLSEPLAIGNLDAQRDWGFAGEYVEGMWRILQHDTPDDYVLATGRRHSVRDFVGMAAAALGFDLAWEGAGRAEIGRDRASGRVLVRVDPANFRPVDVAALVGDASKTRRVLGWSAAVRLDRLVAMMVEADYDRTRRGEALR